MHISKESVIMKPQVVIGCDKGLNTQQAISMMVAGEHFKFVPLVFADVLADRLVLVIAIAREGWEHAVCAGTARRSMPQGDHEKLYEVNLKPSGGRIRIENNKLFFYGTSMKFGPFDPSLLRKANQEELCHLFEVEAVVYE
jgi:hypothetical protein